MNNTNKAPRLRIALLEDDIDHAELIAVWLKGAGHIVNHFSSSRLFLREVLRDMYYQEQCLGVAGEMLRAIESWTAAGSVGEGISVWQPGPRDVYV